jgi:hypothetical protein
MSDPNLPGPTPDQIRALAALKAIVANGDPIYFRARLEGDRFEFYSVTVHYLVADISVLVSNAIAEPLHHGRFTIAIKEIIDRLATLGVFISNWRIVEVDGADGIETDDRNP